MGRHSGIIQSIAMGWHSGTIQSIAMGQHLGIIQSIAMGWHLGTIQSTAMGQHSGTIQSVAMGQQWGDIQSAATCHRPYKVLPWTTNLVGQFWSWTSGSLPSGQRSRSRPHRTRSGSACRASHPPQWQPPLWPLHPGQSTGRCRLHSQCLQRKWKWTSKLETGNSLGSETITNDASGIFLLVSPWCNWLTLQYILRKPTALETPVEM